MSSSNKRRAVLRAQAETNAKLQQLILLQHHYNVLKGVAEGLAQRLQEANDLLMKVGETLDAVDDPRVDTKASVDAYLSWKARQS